MRAEAEHRQCLHEIRIAQLREIFPKWNYTHSIPPEAMDDDSWASIVAEWQEGARIQQENDAAEALRIASERPDREKIEAWASSAIAAIPALPLVASEELRRELEDCEMDVRHRLELLKVETKENA